MKPGRPRLDFMGVPAIGGPILGFLYEGSDYFRGILRAHSNLAIRELHSNYHNTVLQEMIWFLDYGHRNLELGRTFKPMLRGASR